MVSEHAGTVPAAYDITRDGVVRRCDVAAQYKTGAWLHGRLLPQECDLSPDGRYLNYHAMKPTLPALHWRSFVAVSRLP
jgi:hypothetical protein